MVTEIEAQFSKKDNYLKEPSEKNNIPR